MLEQVLFAGFGGQGMLLAGQILAEAGRLEGRYVSWLPSYGPEMRGGTANCSVCVSDHEISSPVITSASCVVAMNRPSLDKFESMVRPGGLLIVNSSLIDVKASRDDIKVVYVEASTIAEREDNPRGANIVVLGAYLQLTGAVDAQSVMDAMTEKMGEKFAGRNTQVLYAGMDAAKEA